MTGNEWIVAIPAVLALAISILALVYSRRATITAERSTAVSERQEQRQVEQAAERAVRWRFAPQPFVYFADMPRPSSGTDAIAQMVNEGEGTARDVRVELVEGDQVIGGPLVSGLKVHSNEWVPLPTSTAGYGEHRELRVHWRVAGDGPVRSRDYDLRGRAL